MVEPRGDPPVPDCSGDRWAGHTFSLGRYIMIDASCVNEETGSWYALPSWERPAICKTDSNCVGFLDQEYSCHSGLCQHADENRWPPGQVTRREVTLLCYAAIPRSETVGVSLEAALHWRAVDEKVDRVCGEGSDSSTVCETPLPDGCLQPF